MRRLAVILLLAAAPACAGQGTEACQALCGNWSLQASGDAPVEARIDAALATYKAPRPRHESRPIARDARDAAQAAAEDAIGPVFDRPERAGLRAELLGLLRSPQDLEFASRGPEIEIRSGKTLARRVEPGRKHSRVDELGTAKIRTAWTSGALVITEKYDRRHEQQESYKLQKDGTLLVVREVERPGVKTIRVEAVYIRH